MAENEQHESQHESHFDIAMVGCVIGFLLGIIVWTTFGMATERQKIWRQGVAIGTMMGREQEAARRNDEPLAQWYRSVRLQHPEWIWDREYMEEYFK